MPAFLSTPGEKLNNAELLSLYNTDSRERLAPFHLERLDYRNQDREAFYSDLERNGPKSVTEFRQAFG